MIRSNDILTKEFPTTKFREGYEVEEVDSFLDELANAYRQVEQGATRFVVSADTIVEKQFSATRFADGYDQVAVDDFLDDIAADVQSRQGDGSLLSDDAIPAEPAADAAVDAAESHLRAAVSALGAGAGAAGVDEAVAQVAAAAEAEQVSVAGDVADGVAAGQDAALEDLGGLASYEVISALQFARIKVRGMARDRIVVVGPDGRRYPIESVQPGEDSVTIQLGDA